MPGAPELVHATAIALGDDAVLICGPSGSGKSDLALRCLAQGSSPLWPGAPCLVSDDQVSVTLVDAKLVASAPATIAGKLEIRGLGILTFPHRSASIRLIADLVPPDRIDRLPDALPRRTLLGVPVPVVPIAPSAPSAAIKLLVALARHAELARYG